MHTASIAARRSIAWPLWPKWRAGVARKRPAVMGPRAADRYRAKLRLRMPIAGASDRLLLRHPLSLLNR